MLHVAIIIDLHVSLKDARDALQAGCIGCLGSLECTTTSIQCEKITY